MMMSKRERFKDEIPFREMTPAQKRSYLWDYWRWPVLAVIVLAVFLISLIRTMVTSKEPLLSVTLTDATDEDQDSMTLRVQQFADTQGIPRDQLQISNTVVGTAEYGGGAMSQAGMAFYVRLQSGAEDLVVMPEEAFREYAESGYFMDLTDVVPDEWKDKLIVVEQRYDEYEQIQPEPIACALRTGDIPGMPDTIFYQNAVIAISFNPANTENATLFLADLLEK